MAWVVLVLSGMFEAVWAAALSASRGLRRPLPSVLFLLTLGVSIGGLAWAMRTLPTGTAYAVWVGVGASLTVLWGRATGAEQVGAAKALLLVLLVASVVALKVVS